MIQFVIAALLISVAAQKNFLATYKTCCQSGEKLAKDGKECDSNGPVAGIQPEQQSICLSAMDMCCSNQKRKSLCTVGANNAREGKSCTSNTGKGADVVKVS